MIVDVILGVTTDTKLWILELKMNNAENIIVLDYDYFGKPKLLDNIIVFSAHDTQKYIENFDTVNFYKSLVGFPGMQGNMTSLFKKR